MVQLHSRIRQSQSIQINTGLLELLAGLSEGGVVKIDAEKVDHPSPRISHEQSRGDHRVSLDGVTRVMGQIVVLVVFVVLPDVPDQVGGWAAYGASTQIAIGDGNHRMRKIPDVLKHHFRLGPEDLSQEVH